MNETVTIPLRPGITPARDGTDLGWISLGQGPGLVIVHGAMQSAHSQLELGQLLSQHFTVHLLDRRGRGRSGPYPQDGSRTQIEIDDLAAVLDATAATRVLGISSGALITLRAALQTRMIAKAAIFEPPLAVNGSIRLSLIDRFMRESDADDTANAMVTGMLAAEMGPTLFRRLPRPALRAMTNRMIARDDAQDLPPDDPHLRLLAQLLRIDLQIVAENADRLSDFAAINTPTLLIAGTKTPRYLQTAVSALAAIVPNAQRVELKSTNHSVTQNRDQFGKPEKIAPDIARFFAQ
jgi:pimeloyl-ACP methyl ester carboxylesterase